MPEWRVDLPMLFPGHVEPSPRCASSNDWKESPSEAPHTWDGLKAISQHDTA
jgi:hypothetical protein